MALPILIFLAVALAFLGGYYALTSLIFRDASRISERVDSEFRKAVPGPAARSLLFKDLDQIDVSRVDEGATDADPRRRSPGGALAPRTAPRRPDLRSRLQTMLRRADLPISVRQLLTVSAFAGFGLGMLMTLFRGPILGLAAAAFGSAAPIYYVRLRCKQRRDKFLAQFPAAFDLMARVIRAGQSVPQALQAVSDSIEGPLASEFGRCHKQQNLGLRPEVTFQELAERTGILEMRIFVMAMILQRQTGGNLSDVLTRLSTLVRERLRLHRQVRALTAEGRLQGMTLVVLPFLLFAALMVMNRHYAEQLLLMPKLLLATAALMTAGVFWIRNITRFD